MLFIDEMNNNLSWILFLMLQCVFVSSHPIHNQEDKNVEGGQQPTYNGDSIPKYEHAEDSHDKQVISVRITSSVAVGRTKGKSRKNADNVRNISTPNEHFSIPSIDQNNMTAADYPNVTETPLNKTGDIKNKNNETPPNLVGANIEFIKQLNAKKEAKESNIEQIHPFGLKLKTQQDGGDEEILEESSSTIDENDDVDYFDGIPLARKIPTSLLANQLNERGSSNVLNLNETEFLNSDDGRKHELIKNNNSTEYRIKWESQASNMSNNNDENITNTSLFLYNDGNEGNKSPINGNKDDNKEDFTIESDDSIAEPSIKSVLEVTPRNDNHANIENIRNKATAISQQNYFQDFRSNAENGRENTARQTTISFSIVHDAPKSSSKYNEANSYITPNQPSKEQSSFYESPKIYSEPARIYSEPAKFYSEPSKIYSEPAKIYSEPAKVYSEPAKIYSEPAKFYSEPASLHLSQNSPPNYTPWQQSSTTNLSTSLGTTPVNTAVSSSAKPAIQVEHQPEKNYEIDEKENVRSNGQSHGVQETTTEKCKQENCKVGYVVEGRQFKKYRVEERTSDGYIVGEYGVVRNEDGALRGVRYTADSDASPRLIYDALMKFLQLR